MTRLDANETMRRFEAAVAEARVFYGIDPLFDTPIYADGVPGNSSIQIKINPGYYHRPISVDLDYYQRNPHRIREDAAHEVAHLVSDELACIMQRMPPEWRDSGEPCAMLLIDALERLTVRLEKLYLRERPEVNDEPG